LTERLDKRTTRRKTSALGWLGEASGPAGEGGDRDPRRAVVVHPTFKSKSAQGVVALRAPNARLEEAVNLTAAIDLEVAAAQLIMVRTRRPATLFGEGQVEQLAALGAEVQAGLFVIDGVVSPIQQRNLEKALNAKVIDRTGLILDIFGARARTREGALQVELAHLTYQQSRLVRSWTHLERQRGGFGFLGGPGETQIETDRRLIRERIAKLRTELAEVTRTRALHRARRKKAPYPVIALVGYTNAGKSTLFNRMSGAAVMAKDLLFATLDPTMRGIDVPGTGRVILSDTVGFISDLPTQLVAAFRATLEEVVEADLLLHVRDAAHPDSEAQRADVLGVLAELGLDGPDAPPVLEVLNKIDALAPELQSELRTRAAPRDDVVCVSAISGEGMDDLAAKIGRCLHAQARVFDLTFGHDEGPLIAKLYTFGDVLGREDADDGVHIKVRLSADDYARVLAWRAAGS
jgi:GTPase